MTLRNTRIIHHREILRDLTTSLHRNLLVTDFLSTGFERILIPDYFNLSHLILVTKR